MEINPVSTGSTATSGFMPINNERRTSEAAPETSSVQSRDYSGGSEFYGYNYPASYGPPSSSYGSSGKHSGIETSERRPVLSDKLPGKTRNQSIARHVTWISIRIKINKKKVATYFPISSEHINVTRLLSRRGKKVCMYTLHFSFWPYFFIHILKSLKHYTFYKQSTWNIHHRY